MKHGHTQLCASFSLSSPKVICTVLHTYFFSRDIYFTFFEIPAGSADSVVEMMSHSIISDWETHLLQFSFLPNHTSLSSLKLTYSRANISLKFLYSFLVVYVCSVYYTFFAIHHYRNLALHVHVIRARNKCLYYIIKLKQNARRMYQVLYRI